MKNVAGQQNVESLAWTCWVNQFCPPSFGLKKKRAFLFNQAQRRWNRNGFTGLLLVNWSPILKRILSFFGLSVFPVLWVQSGKEYCIFDVFGILCSMASRISGLGLALCCNEQLECSLKIRTFNFLISPKLELLSY